MNYSRGFTLIEVAISIFIIGILLILLQSVLHTVPLVKGSTNKGVALSIAKNELESLRTGGYAALSASGSFSDSLLSTIPQGAGSVTVTTYNTKTKSVTVTVTWQDPGQSGLSSVSLATLITQVGGLP